MTNLKLRQENERLRAENAKLRGDVDFLAIMTDVDLETDEDKIQKELALLERMYPDFAACQNSTMAFLRGAQLHNQQSI